jgi:hypothetical protein
MSTDRGSFFDFNDFVNAVRKLKVDQFVKLVIPQNNDIEGVEKKVQKALQAKTLTISSVISESAIKVEKTYRIQRRVIMHTVASLQEIRTLMKKVSTLQAFAVAEDLSSEQFDKLIADIEESGDLVVLEYESETVPRTITVGCRV